MQISPNTRPFVRCLRGEALISWFSIESGPGWKILTGKTKRARRVCPIKGGGAHTSSPRWEIWTVACEG